MTEERQLTAKVSCEVRKGTLTHLLVFLSGLCDGRHKGQTETSGQGTPVEANGMDRRVQGRSDFGLRRNIPFAWVSDSVKVRVDL
jgi:hypothetical protein